MKTKKKLVTILLFLSIENIFSQVNLNSGLTACYSLNGNANEPINALTGLVSSVSPTLGHLGVQGTGMYFQGQTNSYIELPDDPLLKPTNAISFSAWIKADVVTTTHLLFTKNTVNSNFEAYCLSMNPVGNSYIFRVTKGDNSQITQADCLTNVTPGVWYHVVFTMDNANIYLYVNNVLEATVPTSVSFNYQSGKKVYVGVSNESWNFPFTGSMDNIRFYNRVLNAAEVSQLYSQDPSCTQSPGGLPPTGAFSVSKNSLCVGQPLVLTDQSTNMPTAWNWQITGASPSQASISQPTVTFSNPGVYSISLVSSNSFGNSNAVVQTITVAPLPAVGIIGNPTICIGQSTNLNAGGAISYIWSTSQTSTSIQVSPTITTQYSVSGQNVHGCFNTASFVVYVQKCAGLKENTPMLYSFFPNPIKDILTIEFLKEESIGYELIDLEGRLLSSEKKLPTAKLNIDLKNVSTGICLLKLYSDYGVETIKVIKAE